ncbi:MAG: GDP-mannose 4,6-dehydratase [Patescibacteria group bacterium]|nr:GDP-mannose 4,6-dehydratase [Patescibacteria group bacterium]
MKKVFITGVGGFAGSHLCELLTKDKKVQIIGTDLKHNKSYPGTVKIVTLDLTQRDKTEDAIKKIKPDEVYHLAALTSPAKSFQDPFQTLENNLKAQINLLEALRVHKPDARVLIIGSADEYGLVKKEDNPVDEKQPLRPTNPYAVSKITQDYLALQYVLAYKMPIVRVRPFNHIGPRQSPNFVVSAFAKQLAEIEAGLKEAIISVGNLSSVRDFTDVRDMMRAYQIILEKGVPGEVYNIGSGRGYKMEEILNLLLSMTAKKIKIQVDKTLLRPIDEPILVCNYNKINGLTGWKPKISISETLKSVLDYWRDQV